MKRAPNLAASASEPAVNPSSEAALSAVRDLEQSIATRRAALEESRSEVTVAEQHADEIRAEARTRAAREAAAARDAILVRARERADQIRTNGRASATRIHRAAMAAEERDVTALVTRVIGPGASS